MEFSGKNLINETLTNIEKKVELSDAFLMRYVMRAFMAGLIIVFGYCVYFMLLHYFAKFEIDFNGVEGVIKTPGLAKMLASVFFPLCLVCIYYSKSELLTSNMMMFSVAKYFKQISFKKFIKILILCLLGNVLGGIIMGSIFAASSIMTPFYQDIASAVTTKLNYVNEGAILDLVIRACLCNVAINLVMVIVYSKNIKDDVAKIIVIFFGVFAFCFLGLEHSVANACLFIMCAFYELFHQVKEPVFELMPAMINVFWAIIGNFIGGGIIIGVLYSYLNDHRKISKN